MSGFAIRDIRIRRLEELLRIVDSIRETRDAMISLKKGAIKILRDVWAMRHDVEIMRAELRKDKILSSDLHKLVAEIEKLIRLSRCNKCRVSEIHLAEAINMLSNATTWHGPYPPYTHELAKSIRKINKEYFHIPLLH